MLPEPPSYPLHCEQPTTLGAFGWRCQACGVTLPFRDAEGRTWHDQRLGAIAARFDAALGQAIDGHIIDEEPRG